jgi:hypothetical protein
MIFSMETVELLLDVMIQHLPEVVQNVFREEAKAAVC